MMARPLTPVLPDEVRQRVHDIMLEALNKLPDDEQSALAYSKLVIIADALFGSELVGPNEIKKMVEEFVLSLMEPVGNG